MKILLIAGHGAGDLGASGCGYKEADLTRELVTLIKPMLDGYADVTVFDFDRKMAADLKSGIRFNFKPYDYVFEVHFNAAGAAAKGAEVLIHSKVSDRAENALILRSMASLGFINRGVKRRNDLIVMNTCYAQGARYALFETCFISNAEDMRIYQSKKFEIAEAVTNGIIEGLKLKEDKPMTNEERTKFNKLVNAVSALSERVDKLDSKMIYGYVDDNMPSWAKPTILKLMDKGVLRGNEKGNLNLDENMLRTLVILDRAGIFKDVI